MQPPVPDQYDVVIFGNHPATYLAGVLLRRHSEMLKVLHLPLGGMHVPDRVVLINPELFHLHPALTGLQKRLELTGIHGVCFLSDDPQTHSEYRGKTVMSCAGKFSAVTQAMRQLAGEAGVILGQECQPEFTAPDESGITFHAGDEHLRAKAILVGDLLDKKSQKVLSLQPTWDEDVNQRLSFVPVDKLYPAKLGVKKSMPMSLDLKRSLHWGWFLPFGESAQPSVLHAASGEDQRPLGLLRHWISILKQHDITPAAAPPPEAGEILSMEMPLAGALGNEGVGDRALAFGPAGGFYAATGEDIYPNCWSAVFAVDVLVEALRERQLQDALQQFRQSWRTSLGEYLRGPQQNLRLLLPLVYRNRAMTARLAESILEGRSVVRPEASDNEGVP